MSFSGGFREQSSMNRCGGSIVRGFFLIQRLRAVLPRCYLFQSAEESHSKKRWVVWVLVAVLKTVLDVRCPRLSRFERNGCWGERRSQFILNEESAPAQG